MRHLGPVRPDGPAVRGDEERRDLRRRQRLDETAHDRGVGARVDDDADDPAVDRPLGARGWIGFWSAETGAEVAPPSLLNGSWILDVEVSPDGRMLAASNREGATALLDVETRRPYGLPITEEARWIWPVFSADSRRLTVFVEDGEAVEFSVVPADWVTAACSAAGRDLTDAELETLLPGARDRTPTCPQ